MANYQLTHEMNQYAVIVAMHARHSGIVVAGFLEVEIGSHQQGCVACSEDQKAYTAFGQCQDTTICTVLFQKIIDANFRTSTAVITRVLRVFECSIRKVVHERIPYKL